MYLSCAGVQCLEVRQINLLFFFLEFIFCVLFMVPFEENANSPGICLFCNFNINPQSKSRQEFAIEMYVPHFRVNTLAEKH